MKVLVFSDPTTGELLERGVLVPSGHGAVQTQDLQTARSLIEAESVDMAIVDCRLAAEMGGGDALQWLCSGSPAMPKILLASPEAQPGEDIPRDTGYVDILPLPLRTDQALEAVSRGERYRLALTSWARQVSRRDTSLLQRRVEVLETLSRIGRSVTASLNLDEVLKMVVDAAVELTGAEEGSLLILDAHSGELTMRAARNFQDDFVRTFRLPVKDTLAGEVIRTGQPVLLDKKTPQKIKTSYLVKTLIYVPLRLGERVVGVLGVDNRESDRSFREEHITLMSMLADYATVAIENARLYERSELERRKLSAILASIQDGVIVVDEENRLLLVNRAARKMFSVQGREIEGRLVSEVFQHQDLLDLFSDTHETFPYRTEIELEDGRVVAAYLTQVPQIGLTLTLHDVTTFKELDRIKSEFVSTVSHDLRSPLTAILGYVELLERVGPLNDKQRAFVQRVQASVSNITELINDLLDLGRIEAGMDERKILLSLRDVIAYSVEELRSQALEKQQNLMVEVDENLPPVLGDSVRLRQVVDNLVGNAIRYTPEGGEIYVRAWVEQGQVFLQVKDTGVGIPAADLPHIFEKFYRASNVVEMVSGSGLGLAIVKSIVENHDGRIWVDSEEGKGSTFTVVLPVAPPEARQ